MKSNENQTHQSPSKLIIDTKEVFVPFILRRFVKLTAIKKNRSFKSIVSKRAITYIARKKG